MFVECEVTRKILPLNVFCMQIAMCVCVSCVLVCDFIIFLCRDIQGGCESNHHISFNFGEVGEWRANQETVYVCKILMRI